MESQSSFKYFNRILKCRSVDDVWAFHAEKMKEYGFDRLLYISTHFQTHGVLGDIEDAVVLTNRARGFVNAFITQGLYKYGPLATWAGNGATVRSWRIFEERYKAADVSVGERRIHELNKKWCLLAGYVIRFDEIKERDKSVIGLCAREGLTQDDVDALWEKKSEEIVALNNIMHLKVSALPHTGQRRPLTNRQREVLEWTADGKTMHDIATILDISIATVEKHLRLAREALGVETTVQAVEKAATLNLLFLSKGIREPS